MLIFMSTVFCADDEYHAYASGILSGGKFRTFLLDSQGRGTTGDAEALDWPTLACANIGTEKPGWGWSRADRLRAHGMHNYDFLSFSCANVSDG